MLPDWVRHEEFGHQTRVMEVRDGYVHWSEKLKLPIQPMVGVLGVAPVHGAMLTVDNGAHGGNLDVQEIATGNTVMFACTRTAPLFMSETATPCRVTAKPGMGRPKSARA